MSKVRRRGAELEKAIFKATLDIVDNEGIENLTFQKVAVAAKTSKPVIYRRWSSTFDLAISAAQDRIRQNNNGQLSEYPLTGDSLREDLLQLIHRFMVSVDFIGQNLFRNIFFQINSEEGKLLRHYIIDSIKIDRQAIDNVLTRAQSRHEPVNDNLPDSTKLLPFEWIRYHVMIQETVDDTMINSLVDDILLPIYLKK